MFYNLHKILILIYKFDKETCTLRHQIALPTNNFFYNLILLGARYVNTFDEKACTHNFQRKKIYQMLWAEKIMFISFHACLDSNTVWIKGISLTG